MLTLGYCRVSTEEQAEEGFSIAGQADRLRAYALLHDLGTVTVFEDPGLSGKDLKRPGLQQILAAVEAGHVAHVIVWRLDRLSRNLADLILLADKFGMCGVALHSVNEKIDLSSATGRMFYNILGSFAQFYREQLSENVRMGTTRAVHEGRWVNRPKTGYDLVDGALVPNDDADRVRQVFRMRAAGASYRTIEDATGIRYSTVGAIVKSRVYLGEVLHNGTWYPGLHDPIISEDEFRAAQRTEARGRHQSRDLLAGKVICGLCGRRMPVDQNGEGRVLYRCRHRGQGCRQPSRTNVGLHRAALLALRLLADDEDLQQAIRRKLAGAGRGPTLERPRRPRAARTDTLPVLSERRRKLLELYYADRISAELFGEQEAELTRQIEAVREQASVDREHESATNELAQRFEQVAALLRSLDLQAVWEAATDQERRVLVDELLQAVAVFPDHLEVTVAGAPTLNVSLAEVGLKQSEPVGVGGGT